MLQELGGCHFTAPIAGKQCHIHPWFDGDLFAVSSLTNHIQNQVRCARSFPTGILTLIGIQGHDGEIEFKPLGFRVDCLEDDDATVKMKS